MYINICPGCLSKENLPKHKTYLDTNLKSILKFFANSALNSIPQENIINHEIYFCSMNVNCNIYHVYLNK